MNGFDIGLGSAAHLEFSPRHHKGLGHVYPTVVRGGKPEGFSDWAGAGEELKTAEPERLLQTGLPIHRSSWYLMHG